MKSIIRSLFNADIIPWERREPRNEELLELVRKIEDEKRYFIEKMSLDDCDRFQKLDNLYLQLSSAEEENVFSYGFTLGLLLSFNVIDQTDFLFSN